MPEMQEKRQLKRCSIIAREEYLLSAPSSTLATISVQPSLICHIASIIFPWKTLLTIVPPRSLQTFVLPYLFKEMLTKLTIENDKIIQAQNPGTNMVCFKLPHSITLLSVSHPPSTHCVLHL